MSERAGRRAQHGHAVSGFFVFCLLCLFALLATTLVMVGIRAYRGVYVSTAANSEEQIALSYLLNKIRSHDSIGEIELREMDGVELLCLQESIDGEQYETRIYCLDNGLYEYYCEKSDPFDPELGQRLTGAASVEIACEAPRLMRIEIAHEDGAVSSAHIALRVEEAVSP